MPNDSDHATARTFRLSRMAYGIVLLLIFCVTPFAVTAGSGNLSNGTTTDPTVSWRLVFYVVPVLVGLYIARTATIVDADGIRVRAILRSRRMPWDELRGLSSDERNVVYAVLADGAVRLPCVRFNDLAAVAKASGGRLPEIAEPTLKFALSRRPRRGRPPR